MWLLGAHPLAHALQTLAITEPGTALVGKLEREMGKTQGMKEGLWLTGLSRQAISLFLVFLQ